MDHILLRLREQQEGMSRAQQSIAEFIRENTQEASRMTVRELAARSFTSPSSVLRLCRQLGFRGYRDFSESLRVELAMLQNAPTPKQHLLQKDDTLVELMDAVTAQNQRGLEESRLLLHAKDLAACIDRLEAAQRILLFGLGASFLVCRDFQLKLLRVDRDCRLYEDLHSQYLLAMNATPQDLAILVSYSGETKEILHCARLLREQKTPSLAITRYTPSSLSQLVDQCLYISSAEAPLRFGAIASRISQLNLIDFLFLGLLQRNYDASVAALIRTQIAK